MATQTTTLTQVGGPDVCILKTEVFDVDFAKEILENKNISKDERDAVRRLYKARTNGNQHQAQYKLGKDVKSDDVGRFVAVKGTGLQALSRDCRSALAQKFYVDVDIVNAQPTILQQYASKRGWVSDALKEYNTNREEFLEALMDLGMERWEAKQRVVAIVFGGSPSGLSPFFVETFAPEIRRLMRNVFDENKTAVPNVAKRGEKSMMSLILQTEERRCLLALDMSLARQGRSLDVLIHDGGLVRKKDGETRIPEEVLRRCERDILEETGYAVRLAQKELKTTIERKEQNEDETEYLEKKKAWEDLGWKGAVWFKLRHPACFVAMFPDGKLEQLSKSDLLQNEEDNLMTNGDLFIKRWLADPNKREYLKLVFAPKQDAPEGCFNLFQGFANIPKAGEFSAYQESLRIVCGNDPLVFAYVENWLAHILQKPWIKTKVALAFQGEQGAGKDSFWDAVGEHIFGKKYYLSTKTPEHDVFARFNSRAAVKILVKFEEANFQTNKENADKLKGLITSQFGHIEKKGQDTIEVDDFTNIVMTTNNDTPVLIENSDRRFMLATASSERIGDDAFWEDLHAKFPIQASAYHDYLLNKDISNFVPWSPATVPKTEFYHDVKQSFTPYHARFFQKQIELGTTFEYPARTLFTRMKQEVPLSFNLSETRFGRDMRLYVKAGVIEKRHDRASNVYVGDVEKLTAYLKQQGWWVEL